jgi:hypothetical protein
MNVLTKASFVNCVIGLTALMFGHTAFADSMRCGNKLVYSGDTTYTVRTKCGEPDDVIHRSEIRTVSHEVSAPCEDRQSRAKCSRTVETSVEVVIDEWTYDFGSNRFIETLRFEDGKLVRIKDGEYGQKQVQ